MYTTARFYNRNEESPSFLQLIFAENSLEHRIAKKDFTWNICVRIIFAEKKAVIKIRENRTLKHAPPCPLPE